MMAFLSSPCKSNSLAQGLELVHLHSFKSCIETNKQLGNSRQLSQSFFSRGKCPHWAASPLIKSVVHSPSSLFPPAPLPDSAFPWGKSTPWWTECRFTLPPFKSFILLSASERRPCFPVRYLTCYMSLVACSGEKKETRNNTERWKSSMNTIPMFGQKRKTKE